MLIGIKAILRKTRKAAEIIMKTETKISCETLLYSPLCISGWFLACCRNILRYSYVGTGLEFGYRYLLAQSLVRHPDLDQLWHSGRVVFHSAFPPVCASNLYSTHGRGDGNEWWNICDSDGCLLSPSHNRRSTCFGLKRCGNISYTLPAPIPADKPWSESDWYSCDADHPLSRTHEITTFSKFAACFGD